MYSSESTDSRVCLQCNRIFKRQITLDEHILRRHPNYISCVTSKIHECTLCAFKTTISGRFKKHLLKHSEPSSDYNFSTCTHMLKHPETISYYNFSTCTHCDRSFRSKSLLDNHLIKKHPKFISSVTNKIHKCTVCSYETTISTNLRNHLLIHTKTSDSMKHAETPDKHMLSTCRFCQAMFKSKTSVDDHILRKHPTFIASVTSKIHECAKCTFKTVYTNNLKIHSLRHSETRSKYKLSTCTHCNLTFKRKHWLDNHVIRKHPNFIDSVTSKVHECILCGFKTTISAYFKRHMLKHPETSSNYRFSTCTHCDRTFKTKSLLDNHLIKKHPNFVSSVTNKIHKCTMCSYETTISTNLRSHLLIHAKTPAICRPITCPHCKASFNKKISLDDHIIKYHPSFASSVTSKVHKCTKCNFETTMCTDLKRHSMKHAETPDKHMLSTCRFCQATFKSKTSVDDHILRKHPNFIASVTSKIHECAKCTFKTVYANNLKIHSLRHHPCSSKSRDGRACLQCNAIFKRQTTLDEHILRTHPNSISSVTSKLHECTQCAFKTTARGRLKKHLLKHSETSSDYNFLTCTYCNLKFKSKSLLDSHLTKKYPNLQHPKCSQKITCPHCKAKFRRRTLLDNHVIKKHPNFVSSVTSKIYKCTKCAFETTINTHLKRHSLKHTETRPNHRPNTCALCHASFKTKRTLDNHTLQKHPKFIDSVTSKIHECTLCTFKTTMNAGFKEHLLKHPETISSYKFSACTHCDQTFKRKYLLDNHVLKKHPNVISSAINKIYKCTECNYETTISASLRRHMKVHSKTLPNLTCVQCNTTFKRKIFLDDHIVKKHPDFMESVTSRIHECRKCTFKTAFRNDLNRHSLNHLETAPSL
nr:unnamed protein product [Callosobruchus analis]